jgi:hypothetical protein
MSRTAAVEPTPAEAASLMEDIARCLAEVQALHEEMQREQREIERSRERTWATLNQMKSEGLC